MGSAKVMSTNCKQMENTDKKTLKSLFKAIFNIKKEKPKADQKQNASETKKKTNNVEGKERVQKKETNPSQNVNPLASILENFQKLELRDAINDTKENYDESQNFTIKVITEHKTERNNSHASEDSGFSETKEVENVDKVENFVKANFDEAGHIDKVEKSGNVENIDKTDNVDQTEEVIEVLEKLELDDDKKKPKLRTVLVPRGPDRHKVCNYASSTRPYPGLDSDTYRQIHQINQHTLTGGQVIVNQQLQDNLTEFEITLRHVEHQSQLQKDQGLSFDDIIEYINEETASFAQIPPTGSTQESLQDQDEFLNKLFEETFVPQENLAETELNKILNSPDEEYNASNDSSNIDYRMFPTPPASENVRSPVESLSSFYPSNTYECTLSPELSPVYNADYEKYQEIPHFEEEIEKKRERTNSLSSMTMKQFKDMQKDIVYSLSKKECCQLTRKSCKEIFQEHLQKLRAVERKNLCFKVAKLDLKTAFGVLHHILLSLSRGSDEEDLQYALFYLVCGRILTQDASLFAGDAGLSVLKSATLRCPHRAVLARYLVQCARAALRADAALVRDQHAIFHEVDTLGDNLVIACARAGDRCADVLAELVRPEPGQPPLFRTHHANADGYTALHVACKQHSAASSRLHTVHVLLEHAGADLWKGDIKGGDSALHLAVNSATCDLQLIMLIFKYVDRKMWKKLAHCQNMGSMTPIEYARSATKSTTRQNYPHEVLDFLKKCR